MFLSSHQIPMQSVARSDSNQSLEPHAEEHHGKKHRLDFERFSSLPRDMFSFFSRVTE